MSSPVSRSMPKTPSPPQSDFKEPEPLTIIFNSVYHVTAEKGGGIYGPMGIRPIVTRTSVKWEDTGPGQPVIAAQDIKVDGRPLTSDLKGTIPHEIMVTKKNGKKVTFTLFNLPDYNAIRDGAMPEFKTIEDLRTFYLTHNFLQ